MKYNLNGLLICNTSIYGPFVENNVKCINYHGVHEFERFPLLQFQQDVECRELSDMQFSKQIGENAFQFLNFITSVEFALRLIKKCCEKNISLRALFVESDGYTEEIWGNAIPERRFLGYEVMEIPLDPWTLLDLANREQYGRYREELNENGLFKTEETAAAFRETYWRELEAGLVGDGPVDLFLCRIYEVALPDLLKALEP